MRKKSEETSEKVVKNIPTSENGSGVLFAKNSGQQYQITKNTEKQKFTLWKIVDKGFIKMKTASSPVDLYDCIPWDE